MLGAGGGQVCCGRDVCRELSCSGDQVLVFHSFMKVLGWESRKYTDESVKQRERLGF